MYKFSGTISTDNVGKEIREHGTLAYPVACYYNDMSKDLVILHWHEELELIVVKKGAIKVNAGSFEKILNEGEGCFINSDVPHSVWQIDLQDGIINSIVFHAKLIGSKHSIYWQKYINPLIENKMKQFIFFYAENQIIKLIEKAWQVEADENSGFELEVRNLISQIIFLISNDDDKKIYKPTKQELRDMERTKRMIIMIEKNFQNELTLKQISEVAAVSDRECLCCFKRVTGISPIQFLKEYRIMKAAELIRTTNLKIYEIAEQCGFLDMSYFAKTFRQFFKNTPVNYRKCNA